MTIRTKRLNIFPASRQQMEQLIRQQELPELRAAYQEMLDGCLAHPDQWHWYALWHMECNDGSGTLVGSLSFRGLGEDGVVEIGYGTNPEHEGQGYMTEAVSAAVQWAACQEGVTRIEAETEEGNRASKRVLQKAGFLPSGKTGPEGPRYVWKG